VSNGFTEFENVATPIRFVDTVDVAPTYPPELGADTIDILRSGLRLSEDVIASLVADRVVGAAATEFDRVS
jgi:crotonobetainyl-CoA:carnitine CoA-transferase CaiB-like acyl-CoA transferase